MTRPLTLLLALVWALLLVAPPAAAAPAPVEVLAEPPSISATLGDEFSIETTVTNPVEAASGPLLAHLNVASLDDRAYVDPEDWSADRSQELSLAPGESRTLSWDIQAVNSGRFAAYVVVLPTGAPTSGGSSGPPAPETLAVSPQVTLEVATRSTLNAGGALKVVLAMPLLLGITALATRLRIRRLR
jgi:hypothetical protein